MVSGTAKEKGGKDVSVQRVRRSGRDHPARWDSSETRVSTTESEPGRCTRQ